MKKLLVLGFAFISLNSMAQSYFVLNNGVALTLDKAGFIFDFNHFFLPYKIQANGGQFLVAENKLSTVDAGGFLYKKDLKIDKIKGKGLNYFINDDNHLYTIDDQGFFYKNDKDRPLFRKASAFGGNHFLVKEDDKKVSLFTVNTKGNYFKMTVAGLNPLDITTLGGTWFVTKSGIVHTVSKTGNVFAKPDIKVAGVTRIGGNFFIDSTNKIYTVSDEGFLALPALPLSFNVTKIVKVGATYLIDTEGRLFAVDSLGNIQERTMTEHDIREAKVLSL